MALAASETDSSRPHRPTTQASLASTSSSRMNGGGSMAVPVPTTERWLPVRYTRLSPKSRSEVGRSGASRRAAGTANSTASSRWTASRAASRTVPRAPTRVSMVAGNTGCPTASARSMTRSPAIAPSLRLPFRSNVASFKGGRSYTRKTPIPRKLTRMVPGRPGPTPGSGRLAQQGRQDRPRKGRQQHLVVPRGRLQLRRVLPRVGLREGLEALRQLLQVVSVVHHLGPVDERPSRSDPRHHRRVILLGEPFGHEGLEDLDLDRVRAAHVGPRGVAVVRRDQQDPVPPAHPAVQEVDERREQLVLGLDAVPLFQAGGVEQVPDLVDELEVDEEQVGPVVVAEALPGHDLL